MLSLIEKLHLHSHKYTVVDKYAEMPHQTLNPKLGSIIEMLITYSALNEHKIEMLRFLQNIQHWVTP